MTNERSNWTNWKKYADREGSGVGECGQGSDWQKERRRSEEIRLID